MAQGWTTQTKAPHGKFAGGAVGVAASSDGLWGASEGQEGQEGLDPAGGSES